MSDIPEVVQPCHVDTYMYIADAIIPEVDPETLRDHISPDFPMDRLEEYAKLTPSKIPLFRDSVMQLINRTGSGPARLFTVVMTVLESRVAAPTLTGSLTLIRDMSVEQRQKVISSWRDSSLPVMRKLYRSMFTLVVNIYSKEAGELHYKALGHPGRDLREKIYDGQKLDEFVYTMMPHPADGAELYLPDIDALIIGSGAGAGVAAHTLSREGHKCLVLEKGKYYKSSEYVFDDAEGFKALYENGGGMSTLNAEVFILAGSTFGGGTTVNWSACLKTPFKVRKEWYDDYGLEWVAKEEYDKCLDYVWEQMGASKENVSHSFSNDVMLKGSEKLGYPHKSIEQNNGGHPNHDCGFCHLGCKYGIKQGSHACWLKDASDHGCQFMDQVRVDLIIHKNGKAVGVNCIDSVTGAKFKITGPKTFVVSCGSLHTPLLLQSSKFKNKHIGSNLKLHPISGVIGTFGKEINTEPYHRSIMTSVCNEVEDLDGKAHGPKIETLLHVPSFEAVYIPWVDAGVFRQDLLKFNNTAAFLTLARDTSSGKVYADPKIPGKPNVDYSINKFDLEGLLKGVLIGADIMYIQGAKEILVSQAFCPRFSSNKPQHERSITDEDYVEWRKAVEKIGAYKYGYTSGSAHQMSSCRMASKPKNGALDLKGRLYECKNIYVADASAMPTASGANPMISTMTFARHISLDICKDLKPQPRL